MRFNALSIIAVHSDMSWEIYGFCNSFIFGNSLNKSSFICLLALIIALHTSFFIF